MTAVHKLGDIVDLLHTAQYLNEALHMATSDTSLPNSATNALQALCGEVDSKLRTIGDRIEEVAGEVEFQEKALEAVKKAVDGDALLASVRAEIARRKAKEA